METTTVKAHGLDGSLVEPDWCPLTLAELRPVLSHFPRLAEPIEIVFASPRPLSAAAMVRTRNGTVFVKRHARAVRDGAGLCEEHRFIEHLRANGASIPFVLTGDAGETAIEMDGWTYEVHDPAPGVDLYRDAISWTPFFSAAHARQAGAALARMHRAAEKFDAPRRKVQPLVASFTIFAALDPALELGKYLQARPVLREHAGVRKCAAEALDLLTPFYAELSPRLPDLPPLWTHNDLHPSNLFWSGPGDEAQATAIIDFGLSDRTNAVHDLAHAIERSTVGWLDLVRRPDRPDDVPVHLDHLAALLEGYESVRRLTEAETAALAPMTALCHAEFALSEADYLLGVLHAEQSARMAYQGWLVGHARWFHSAAGTRLLDSIRQWGKCRPNFRARARPQ
jgi:Ser/Thr protein kinase RdoA (MazF antagonist)